MTDDLNALADRCEAATGPDRELDVAIARAAAPETLGHAIGYRDDWLVLPASPCKRYTASLDAALTLVPEGWGSNIYVGERCADKPMHVTVAMGRSYPTNANTYGEASGSGALSCSALALCAAALRARAQQEGQR